VSVDHDLPGHARRHAGDWQESTPGRLANHAPIAVAAALRPHRPCRGRVGLRTRELCPDHRRRARGASGTMLTQLSCVERRRFSQRGRGPAGRCSRTRLRGASVSKPRRPAPARDETRKPGPPMIWLLLRGDAVADARPEARGGLRGRPRRVPGHRHRRVRRRCGPRWRDDEFLLSARSRTVCGSHEPFALGGMQARPLWRRGSRISSAASACRALPDTPAVASKQQRDRVSSAASARSLVVRNVDAGWWVRDRFSPRAIEAAPAT
jgi:hypothetical protein